MVCIDTSRWASFQVASLFITNRERGKLHVPTGASVPRKELSEDGDTPRITVSGFNNGVIGSYRYIGKTPSNYRVYNNFISVSFLGTVFYQEGDASLDMKVHCLKPINYSFNIYTGLFMVSAIKASLRESTYQDQFSSSILPELSIRLPVTDSHIPDWGYMENYMKDVLNIARNKLDVIYTI